MSARIVSVEIGYEGPGGPVIIQEVADVPDGEYLPDFVGKLILKVKHRFMAKTESPE